MSNVAKLKKKAADFEQKKQFDKALAVYQQILQEIDGSEDEGDVALFNRAGDLLLRQGSVAEAVDYYEKAVDLYSEGGFFNNAIALCNKILRQSPGRSSIYYKLGKISAKKGFKSDAKQNFLEYADRMQKAGRMDEAFRALKEFADLCPDQDDIRLMLAEQLSKRERKGEALQQLQLLYEKFESEGRTAEARATMDRMKSIDPEAQPKRSGPQPVQKSNDLVFLDVSFDDEPRRPTPRRTAPTRQAPPEPPRREPVADYAPPMAGPRDLELLDLDGPPSATLPVEEPPAREPDDAVAGDAAEEAPLPGVSYGAGFDAGFATVSPDELPAPGDVEPLGIERTSFAADEPREAPRGLEIEPTSFAGSTSGFDGGFGPEAATGTDDLPLLDELPPLDSPSDDSELSFILPGDDVGSGLSSGLDTPSPLAGVDGGLDLDIEVGDLGLAALREEPEPDAGPTLASGLPMLDAGDAAPPRRQAPAAPVEREERPAVPAPPAPAEVAAEEDPDARVIALRDRLEADQGDWALRRQYGEALLEIGEREGGLHELEMAMIGAERAGDLDAASSIAGEIIRVNPNSVRHHQKRVELSFRTGDRSRLVEAYLELADSLFRSGQPDKAQAVYQRVLELAPDDIRAQAALSAFVEATPAAPPPKKEKPRENSGLFRRYTAETKRSTAPAPAPEPKPAAAAAGDDAFVNLGDWVREDETPKSTRMMVEEQAPSGDEQADFADMLRAFKQGVAQNIDEEDHQSHYDLGVAYKEMGLLDEAIAEFQKALRSTENRMRTYEALGQCFLEKGQYQVATTILSRALGEPGLADDQLIGVLYLMGTASEALRRYDDALGCYQRIFAVDIEFRDVSERIATVERVRQ